MKFNLLERQCDKGLPIAEEAHEAIAASYRNGRKTALAYCTNCFLFQAIVPRETVNILCRRCGAYKLTDWTLLPIADGPEFWQKVAEAKRNRPEGEEPQKELLFYDGPTDPNGHNPVPDHFEGMGIITIVIAGDDDEEPEEPPRRRRRFWFW